MGHNAMKNNEHDGEHTPKTGPEPEHIQGDDEWKDAVKKALRKKKPPEGWPRGDDEEDGDDVMGDGT